MALDRARLESIGKAATEHGKRGMSFLGSGKFIAGNAGSERHPAEVVKSNKKKAFHYFFDQDEFVETQYLC
jgi:hypothetical protein